MQNIDQFYERERREATRAGKEYRPLSPQQVREAERLNAGLESIEREDVDVEGDDE